MSETGSTKIEILLFAKAKELAGKGSLVTELPINLSYPELVKQILAIIPGLSEIEHNFVLALNEEYIDLADHLALKAGDVIAVIPPISGG